jgi:hypothetical protein
LEIGESREVATLWVRLEDLGLKSLRQKYSRFESHPYKYKVPSISYAMVLEVDKSNFLATAIYGTGYQINPTNQRYFAF